MKISGVHLWKCFRVENFVGFLNLGFVKLHSVLNYTVFYVSIYVWFYPPAFGPTQSTQICGLERLGPARFVIFFRLSLFSHAKTFLLSTTSCRYHIFSPKFSLTESDTVGPQLFTCSKKFSKLSHQSAEIIFFLTLNISDNVVKKVLWLLCKIFTRN